MPAPRGEPDRKVIRDVNVHGWHVVNVPPESETPGWLFTIGLHHNFSHPELVIFGLDRDVAHSVLNNLGEGIRNGQRYEAGREYPKNSGRRLVLLP